MKVASCRVCDGGRFSPVLHLGDMPPVNYFPAAEELAHPQPRYPLTLCVCDDCGLVQLDEVVPPERLFRQYHYLTSASAPLVAHFAALAAECRDRGWLPPGARAVDIGANDGTLLDQLRRLGAAPLGIDPALNAVRAAAERGIEVLPHFFDDRLAAEVADRYGRAAVVTCTNVLAHTDRLRAFIAGIRTLLAPDGVAILEFAHLLDVICNRHFDVIYHEHVSYFSLQILRAVFARLGLEVFDARKVLTQGGSLRIYARHAGHPALPSSALEAIDRAEAHHRLRAPETLHGFARGVERFRDELRTRVARIRAAGHTIAGLGAPAKSVILLNYCGLGSDDIAFVVDSTPLKQGRFLPGTRIPVLPETALAERPCDHFLMLAWNFQDVLLEKVAPHRARGARVIIPFPELRVV